MTQPDIWGVAQQFADALPQVDVVSFDFFDTFATRVVSQPTHVFAAMEQHLTNTRGRTWDGFARERVLAERQARSIKENISHTDDVTLSEIYLPLAQRYSLSYQQRVELEQLEQTFEINLAAPVAIANELIDAARQAGKRVIVVSDFYMDAQHIVNVAHKIGHTWLDASDVYVSSVCGGTKDNGVLWDNVLKLVGVSPSRMVHVGDNDNADVKQPRARGIRAIHYPALHRSHRRQINTTPDVLVHSKLEATYRDRVARSEWNGANSVGATTASLIVADHVLRARALQQQNPGSSVHFVARDGWLAHELWNQLGYDNGHYLYASRLVVWRTMLAKVDASDAKEFVGKEESLPISQLQKRIGCELRDEKGHALADSLVVDAHRARQLIEINADAVIEVGKKLRSLFVEHLRDQGLLEPGVHFVVDLGWRGKTIADIADIVAKETGGRSQIEGIFTGLYWDASSQLSRIPMHASAVTTLDGMNTQLRLLGMMRIMEACSGAPHGSLVDFTTEYGRVQPVLADTPAEHASYEKYLSLVAKEALEGARSIISGTHTSGVESQHVTGAAIWASMLQVGHDPHDEEVRDLGDVRHVTTLDHLGDGTPLVCAHIPDDNLATTYKTLMRHHWLQGSVCAWEKSDNSHLRRVAKEIRDAWPVMRPDWNTTPQM